MKEVSSWEAMAGTWKEMTPEERRTFLMEVRFESYGPNVGVKIQNFFQENEWWKLPIPARTFLEYHFDGENGRFSKEASDRRLEQTRQFIDVMDRVERSYQMGVPDPILRVPGEIESLLSGKD
jgi:hypothetical protein